MKATALLFVFLMAGAASAETAAPCKLPLYIQAGNGMVDGKTDSTANLFLYGLKAAVVQHQGCIVAKMTDANLDLYVRTLKLIDESGRSDSSVVAVTLAVPLNGVPIYMDDYVLVVRDTENVEGQVNALLESIGETLDRHSSPDR